MTLSSRLAAPPKCKADMGGWRGRHMAAIAAPRPGFESPVVGLISAWLRYGDAHRTRYETGIGDDGVLGAEWEKIGHALIGLLNGDCGRLDCGTLDGVIRDALTAEGLDAEG